MNTNALKRFAKEARIKLLDQVSRKLEFVLANKSQSFIDTYVTELSNLKNKVQKVGKEQLIEMVAYTWFNRFMAFRFMDANSYSIPKVVTPLPGMTNPEILQNALGGNIEPELHLGRKRLSDLLDGKTAAIDAHTEAYKMLLVASCNQWHSTMPFMFEHISDYTELLLPDDLLSDYSIVADIRNGMSDEDCQQEELIGWLYQFYISDKKDDVFEGLKKNIKITAENIPAATQLFTPHWIVRYMVENTLGKLWLTFKPSSKLKQYMPYYIEAPEGNAPAPLPEGIEGVTDITFLDPCQGSGHVLVYAFDLFTKIYEEEGYNTNEIPALILQHNLFGIDIDERAAQLAAFALTMKARSYYPRFLRKPVHPHVIALENVSEDIIKQAVKIPLAVAGKLIYDYRDLSFYLLTHADNYGSLIQIDPIELKAIQLQKGSLWEEQELKMVQQAEYLSRKYHCVVTNPPYMGQKSINSILKAYVDKYYKKGKSDLMACFMERCLFFNQKNGKTGMINQHSWMFLSSYEELRPLLIDTAQFETMLHLGPRTFPEIGGEVVQNTAFTFGNYNPTTKGVFIRLTDFENAQSKEYKTIEAIHNPNCGWIFTTNQKDFAKIPSSPIGYWLSPKLINTFKENANINSNLEVKQGLATGNNEQFLRMWYEVSNENSNKKANSIHDAHASNKKWFPYNKGGGYRKWYGNQYYFIAFDESSFDILKNQGNNLPSRQYYFKECITWSDVSSGNFACRYSPAGFIFDVKGSSGFTVDLLFYKIAHLNSIFSSKVLFALNPTMSYQVGNIKSIPFRYDNTQDERIHFLTHKCIETSRLEWDSRETSWDFQHNELIKQHKSELKAAVEIYTNYWTGKFYDMHLFEEELNRRFIEIYGLQDELTPDVPFEEITILQEEGKIVDDQLEIQTIPLLLQLISYTVGCMFGRYNLDKPGLNLANQGESLQDFLKQVPNPSYMPDEDNIIPVLEGEWFTDDIVGRFKGFLIAAFGEEHYEENLKYIEDTIGKDIRKYFVKDFYNDHVKRYKKRPIYWMFSSPKGHFKALIYMHRYQSDLCSKLLNDYLQAFISKLEASKQTKNMFSLREDISAREKTDAVKEIDRLELILRDCREYEKTLFTIATQKISIDLDDGVKVNYHKFKKVLVPIKGLEKEEE